MFPISLLANSALAKTVFFKEVSTTNGECLPHGRSWRWLRAMVVLGLSCVGISSLSAQADRAGLNFAVDADLPPMVRSERITPGMQSLLNERDADLDRLKSSTGVDWWVRFNEDTRTARIALAAAAPVAPGVVESDADLFALADEFLSRHGSLFGTDDTTIRPYRVRRSQQRRIVQYQQVVSGFLAPQSVVSVVFFQRPEALVLSRVDARVFPGLSEEQLALELDESSARGVVVQKYGAGRIVEFAPTRLEIVPGTGEKGAPVGRLAYRFQVQLVSESTPIHRAVWIDSEDGAILGVKELVHHGGLSGNVSGWATPGLQSDISTNPETLQSIPGLTVSVPGVGSDVTDSNGAFSIPYSGTGSVTANLSLLGPWVNVNNDSGSDAVVSGTITPGAGASFVFNPTSSALDTAQVNAMIHTNLVHEFIKDIDPTFTSLDYSMPCNVNIDDECNAFYFNGTINFFLAGGGCANSSYSTVIYHEYGHAVIDAAYPFGPTGSYHEGIADVCTFTLTGDPRIGLGFEGGFSVIRNVDTQDVSYPAGLTSPIHIGGLMIGGAFWDTLEALESTVGTAQALDLCRDYFLFHMDFLTGQISPELTIDVLTVDDDDGNLLNGTPHWTEINQGFSAHGLPGPDLDFIVMDHTPVSDTLPDAIDPVVLVTAVPTLTPGLDEMQLRYRVGLSGAFTTVDMLPTAVPNQYTANLPAVSAPNVVQYYLYAEDGGGNVELLPETGSQAPFSFLVGEVVSLYSEPVGTTDAGWVHVELATQDDWQRGFPNEEQDNAWDALTAPSSPFVWGNDLNPSGWNGDYQNDVSNWLESPSVDCSGQDAVYLRLKRWLTVEEGIYDQARIQVDGTQIWTNPVSGHLIDDQWVSLIYDITSLAAGDSDVRVRFTLESDGGLVFGGWNIDDIEIVSVIDPALFTMEVLDAAGGVGTVSDMVVTATNEDELIGYSIAASYDTTQLTCVEITIDGTDIGGLNPDFVFATVFDDDGICALDVTKDFLELDLIPVGVDMTFGRMRFEVEPGTPVGVTSEVSLGQQLGTLALSTDMTRAGSIAVVPLTTPGTFTVEESAALFRRGDINGDGGVDVTDAVEILAYLFVIGTETPTCFDAADVDDSGSLEVTDAVYLLEFLFILGPVPPVPFDVPGVDPTADGLECDLP